MRVKLDYNNLLRQIDDVLSENEEAQERGTAFGIAVGLELLSSYLRQIAERAIEIEDEVLLGLLKDLYIVKESEGNNATIEAFLVALAVIVAIGFVATIGAASAVSSPVKKQKRRWRI